MKSPDYNESLLEECLARLCSEELRGAASALIDHAIHHPNVVCQAVAKGYIRDFRYLQGERQLIAFIFNRESLLLYIRRPALASPSATSIVNSAMERGGLVLQRTQAGEYTVRICDRGTAGRVIKLLIDPIVSSQSTVALQTREHKGNQAVPEPIRRPAALVRQGQLRLYTTSLQARQLMIPRFYDIERLDPANTHDRGFQRVLNTARAKRLSDYLLAGQEHHDSFLPTSIFLATDQELVFDGERNILEIDLSKSGAFSVVDGQHRLEGLRGAVERDPKIGSFEVPVNIAVGLSKIAQMCHFLIVNTTQKSVDKAVEQRLVARLTEMIEVEDVPTLPKWIRRLVESGDDANALRLIDYLNQTPGSPWLGKIEMPNSPAEASTIKQKSFAVAIKKYVLAASNPLSVRPLEQQEKIFLNYWRAIADELGSEEETVLFKYIGVDLFCRFSGTVFGKLQSRFSVDAIRAVLRSAFDNMEGDFAGLGHPDWWLSGSGPAGGLNSSALGKINQELAKAIHRAEGGDSITL